MQGCLSEPIPDPDAMLRKIICFATISNENKYYGQECERVPRPFKPRRVSSMPHVTFFKPSGIPMTLLEEIVLTVDELEALRLKDLEGFEQYDCASRMNVAQSTLQRILVSARAKVTRAIVEGKALRIQGGVFSLHDERFCPRCKKKIAISPLEEKGDCPECSKEVKEK